MTIPDLPSVAASLRAQGYEARNLAQVGVTVWNEGRGLFLSADDVRRLNGDVLHEVATVLGRPAGPISRVA